MKTQIKIFLIVSLSFQLTSGYSQQNYYWSGDKKNLL